LAEKRDELGITDVEALLRASIAAAAYAIKIDLTLGIRPSPTTRLVHIPTKSKSDELLLRENGRI